MTGRLGTTPEGLGDRLVDLLLQRLDTVGGLAVAVQQVDVAQRYQSLQIATVLLQRLGQQTGAAGL